MLTFSAILGTIYVVGLIIAFFKINRYLNIKNADNDPEGLDALTAMGASVLWPVWIFPYSVYRMVK
jgi:hypothetical protein